MYADLHLHSTFSDGTDTPLELCNLAKNCGLSIISITDHDTVSGQKALSHGQLPNGIRMVSGVEISIEVNRKMTHILGYYIDLYDKRLENFIHYISAEKTASTKANFENACANNVFSYEWERVLELNPECPRISGVNVVKAMQIDGYEVPGMGVWEMFHKYFWPENDNYISRATLTGYDAIDTIKAIGGISVIAHPKALNDDDIVLDLIKHGAKGLEVYHPIHNDEDAKKYIQMAESKNLFVSGGTDWHGKNNGNDVTRFAMKGLSHENYEILKLTDFHK